MAGRQAKILTNDNLSRLLRFAEDTRNPERNRAMVLLSAKAGLRAGEIANLTWSMVLEPDGLVGTVIALHNEAAKRGSGRTLPLNAALRQSLIELHHLGRDGRHIVRSRTGAGMTPLSIVVWFNRAFQAVGLEGCSSHSGRRTFITRAARLVHEAGGSLRDVQLLAGHRSIQTTQHYIDGDSDAQRRLVSLI